MVDHLHSAEMREKSRAWHGPWSHRPDSAAGALSHSHPTGSDLVRMLLLVGLGGFYAEAADRIERLRRYLGSGQVWSDQISVWTLAGALLLPAGCAGLVVALSYAHVLVRA